MSVEDEIGKAAEIVSASEGAKDCPFSDAEIKYAKRFIRRGMQLDSTLDFMRWSFHIGKWWVAVLAVMWARWDEIIALVRGGAGR